MTRHWLNSPLCPATIIALIIMVVGLLSPAMAVSAPATEPSTAPAASQALTVAILDFDANLPASPELGKQIGDVLVATLSGDNNITLVDRANLSKTLAEHELNLTGLVDQTKAVKIGQLVGAKLLITGRAFVLDKQIYITAKIVGVETSLLDAVVVKGTVDGDVGALVLELSDKLSKRIKEVGPKLMAVDERALDPLPALKARLAGRKLPKVAVKVTESHVAEHPVIRVDPAVETELKAVLIQCGFTVDENEEAKWGEDGVELVISGEAFSEFQARIGNLVSCSARLELKVNDRKSGTVVFTDRVTARAADLAENTAAKTALERAGHELAVKLLEHFDKTLPPPAK